MPQNTNPELLKPQLRSLNHEIDQLHERKRRLLLALEGVDQLININKARETFTDIFLARVFELPTTTKVAMYSNDWSGKAASAFAHTHETAARKLANACTETFSSIDSYRTQLQSSTAELSDAKGRILDRILQISSRVMSKQNEATALQTRINASTN